MLVVVDYDDVGSNLILLCMDGELNRTRGFGAKDVGVGIW